MRNLRRLLALLVLMAICLTSLGLASVALAEATFPIVPEKITLKMLVPYNSERLTEYKDLQIFKDYEEKTNIHIEFIEVSTEAWQERVPLVLASGDLPDVIACGNTLGGLPNALVTKFAQQGLIVPLDNYIENTVNMKKMFEARPDFKRLSTYPDGHIYSIADVDENLNLRAGNMLLINKTWLDKLGLPVPSTMDEFGDYLRAVKSSDLNGNGVVGDEIAFSCSSQGFKECSQIKLLLGAFGITDSKSHLYVGDDNKLIFSPTSEKYLKATQYLHQWFAEGLIDPEIITQDNATLKAKATAGIGSALAFWILDLNNADQTVNEYVIIPPLAGPDGEKTYLKNGVMPTFNRNGFVITSANKYPQETMQWLDYWLDNGNNTLTMRFGNEGDTWSWGENGKWAENTLAKDGKTTVNYAYASQYSPWTYVVPFWQFSDLWSKKDITRAHALMRGQAIADWYFPVMATPYPDLPFSEEDTELYTDITTDLFSFVENQFAVFLTSGVTDAQWAEYVKACDAYGVADYLALAQRYFDAYVAN